MILVLIIYPHMLTLSSVSQSVIFSLS